MLMQIKEGRKRMIRFFW